MIIGIDGHMIGDHSGGNENYYTNILKNMNVDPNDIIYLFVKPGTKRESYMEKFHIVEFKEESAFRRNFIELPRLCRIYKLELLHTQYFIPFNRPCPVVCTIHDICFEHFSNIFTKKEYIRQKILIPYAARRSKYIFTVSDYSRNDIAAHYNIPKDRIIVTYCAVSDEYRTLTSEEIDQSKLREKYGIKRDYILTVGNLQPRKNMVRLIKAYRSLTESGKICEQLVIVGKKAWLFDDILREAVDDNNDIIFTDYVSEDDLIRLYNDAEIFVYPSFFEGFGMPPLEAMACGTPVAVANTTSLPEVVGEAGVYFDPFDLSDIERVVTELLDDSNITKGLIELGHERIKKYDWKNSAYIIVQTYHKLMSR